MLVETLSFSSSSRKAWSHPWLSSSQCPPRPTYQLIQPTRPPKYDPSSPIPHLSAMRLQKPGCYLLPAHPLFRLISFQQPERLLLSLLTCILSLPCSNHPPRLPSLRARAEDLDALKTLHHLSPCTPLSSPTTPSPLTPAHSTSSLLLFLKHSISTLI